MTTDPITLAKFLATNRITATVERADSNPSMDDNLRQMDHWKVTLKFSRRRMTVPFSMGSGHNGAAPELASVLDCLASDSAGYVNARSFEDWCSEYGYDTDSRKAERTFNACKRQAERLREFLGDALYEQLLWNTERE
jgi:hypothetical protein